MDCAAHDKCEMYTFRTKRIQFKVLYVSTTQFLQFVTDCQRVFMIHFKKPRKKNTSDNPSVP